jgi:hypothetical protein
VTVYSQDRCSLQEYVPSVISKQGEQATTVRSRGGADSVIFNFNFKDRTFSRCTYFPVTLHELRCTSGLDSYLIPKGCSPEMESIFIDFYLDVGLYTSTFFCSPAEKTSKNKNCNHFLFTCLDLFHLDMSHPEPEACSSQSSSNAARKMETSPARSRKRKTVLIENPRQLAAKFACSVTIESTSSTHWVAKNGENSLFKTLQRMIPEVSILEFKEKHINMPRN